MLQSLTIVLKPFNPLCLGRVRFQLYAKQLQTGRDAVDRVYFVSKWQRTLLKCPLFKLLGVLTDLLSFTDVTYDQNDIFYFIVHHDRQT